MGLCYQCRALEPRGKLVLSTLLQVSQRPKVRRPEGQGEKGTQERIRVGVNIERVGEERGGEERGVE